MASPFIENSNISDLRYQTTGFFVWQALNDYGEALYNKYKKSGPAQFASEDAEGASVTLLDKITFTSDNLSKFYYGSYVSNLSRYPIEETYFAIFYKNDTSITIPPSITISFPESFTDSSYNKKTLTLTLSVNKVKSLEDGESVDNKLIPILAFESTNEARKQEGVQDGLGWIYPFIFQHSSGNYDIPKNWFGTRIKVSYNVIDPSQGTLLSLFVVDMDNPQAKEPDTSEGYSAEFSESCMIPTTITEFYHGNEYNVAYVDYTQDVVDPSGSGSCTRFYGNAGIRQYAATGPTYELACAIAFITENGLEFYVAGSRGVSQLFPKLSAETKTLNFIVDESQGEYTPITESTVYSGHDGKYSTYGSGSGGWPEEGVTKNSTESHNYTFNGWYTEVSSGTKINPDDFVTDDSPTNLYAHFISSIREYTITWNNFDHSLLKSESLQWHAIPSYSPNPTRDSDQENDYVFSGWVPEIQPVSSDITYTATYIAIPKNSIKKLFVHNPLITKNTLNTDYYQIINHIQGEDPSSSDWDDSILGSRSVKPGDDISQTGGSVNGFVDPFEYMIPVLGRNLTEKEHLVYDDSQIKAIINVLEKIIELPEEQEEDSDKFKKIKKEINLIKNMLNQKGEYITVGEPIPGNPLDRIFDLDGQVSKEDLTLPQEEYNVLLNRVWWPEGGVTPVVNVMEVENSSSEFTQDLITNYDKKHFDLDTSLSDFIYILSKMIPRQKIPGDSPWVEHPIVKAARDELYLVQSQYEMDPPQATAEQVQEGIDFLSAVIFGSTETDPPMPGFGHYDEDGNWVWNSDWLSNKTVDGWNICSQEWSTPENDLEQQYGPTMRAYVDNNGCGAECMGLCTSGCYATCVGGCETTCGQDCFFGCFNTCFTDCGVACKESCHNTCYGHCNTTCKSDCAEGCSWTCRGTCGEQCSGCEQTCMRGCNESCGAGCGAECSNHCGNSCTSGCKSTCSGSCSGGCKDGCSGSCKTTCTTRCQYRCETECQDDCQGNCGFDCYSECNADCTSGCQGGCKSSCSESCGANCTGSCANTCANKCKGMCANECFTQCLNVCASNCTSGCGASCYSGCSLSCSESCNIECQRTCGGTCNNGCALRCSGACSTYCMQGCSTNCLGKCKGECLGSCILSCSNKCGKICSWDCTNTCERGCSYNCGATCSEVCSTWCDSTCQQQCFESCQSVCLNACHNECSYNCGYDCKRNCLATCQLQCNVDCNNGCKSCCTNGCYTTCTSGCTGSCAVTCTKSCGSTCSNDCAFECSTDCWSTCAGACSYGCWMRCESTCVGGCRGFCVLTCSFECGDSCNSACTSSCTNGCVSSCTNSCGNNCSSDCGLNCNNDCYGTCKDQCISNCVSTCGTSCSQECNTTCGVDCTAHCDGSCKESCEGACQESCLGVCKEACGSTCQYTCYSSCSTSCIGFAYTQTSISA